MFFHLGNSIVAALISQLIIPMVVWAVNIRRSWVKGIQKTINFGTPLKSKKISK